MYHRSTAAPCRALLALLPVLLVLASLPAGARDRSPAATYLSFALGQCDRVDKQMPEMTRVAEIVAKRHIAGGMIGFLYNYQGMPDELIGRAGGMMCTAFERPWKAEPRTDAEKANDIVIAGWQRAPMATDLARIKDYKKQGCYLIAFGPRNAPAMAEFVPLFDAWFDSGFGADDRVVAFKGGERAGRGNLLVEMLQGWALTAEIVAAMTRAGHMPAMWKSYAFADGREWGDKYYGKTQYHDEFGVPVQPAGKLGKAYVNAIRQNLRYFQRTQMGGVRKAVDLIMPELATGKKVVLAVAGHAPSSYAGKYEDARWTQALEVHGSVPSQVKQHADETQQGALVLRLGYSGMDIKEAELFREKKQRVILICAPNPRPEFQIPSDLLLHIDMGWEFGDAALTLPNYPIRILPPSGIIQVAAYEAINVEVLSRLPAKTAAAPGA